MHAMPAPTTPPDPTARLGAALAAREGWLDPAHRGALRLFAGFYEGAPELVVDLYADTLVVHNYAASAAAGADAVRRALAFYRGALPWLRAAVVKHRHAPDPDDRRGVLAFGDAPAREVTEHGVRYRVELRGARDAGFYLDTRGLRAFLKAEMAGRQVLNAFAYTGSLGVAALAGGASRVVQLDASRTFLNVAKESCTLNGLPIRRGDFVADDFWVAASRLRRADARFDCVVIDPPFFATAPTGTVDLAHAADRLINKVRPLVADGGWLVAVNNALFLRGADYVAQLEALCASGHLTLDRPIDVPPDVTGTAATRVAGPPVDPAPFNHPTKIAVLRVRR